MYCLGEEAKHPRDRKIGQQVAPAGQKGQQKPFPCWQEVLQREGGRQRSVRVHVFLPALG